jgi:hypothetical protein
MKLDLGFIDSIEYKKVKKKSLKTNRTYYQHYLIFRGKQTTFTVSSVSFLDIDIGGID